MRQDLRNCLLTSAAICLASTPWSLAAQTTVQTDGRPPVPVVASGSTSGLQDIIVTARKRSENIQSIPASVSAITSQGLANSGARQLVDISKQISGIGFSQAGGAQPLISVRGDFNRVGVTEPGTGVFIDGVYITRFTQLGRGPVDVSRVEVLKGPQSTLYGKNTIAGAINIINQEPSLSKIEGYAEAGYGRSSESENIWHAEGAISLPIVEDKLAIRITGNHSQRDGYVRDLVNGDRGLGYNSDLVRGILLYKPTDRLTIKLSASYSDNNAPRADVLLYRPGAVIPFSRAGFNQPAIFGPTIWDGGSDIDPYSRSKSWYATGEIRYETGIGDIVSITNFQGSNTKQITNVDGTQYRIGDQYLFDRDKAFQQELRLQGKGGGFSWLGGLYYLNDRDPGFAQQIDFFADSAQGTQNISQQRVNIASFTKTYAAFGQVGYDVTDRLNILGGVRYAEDHRSFPYTFYFLDNAGQVRPGAIFDLDRKKSFKSVTGNAVVTWKFTPSARLYASYSTGNKAGGFSAVGSAAAAVVPFKEQNVRAYEVGLKSEWLNNKLRLNIAGFYNDYSNLQVQRSVQINGGQFNLTQNAAKAKVPGVDVDVVAQVARGLQLNASYTYQDAKIKDYAYLDNVILNNVPIPRSPKHSGVVGASYDTDLGSGKLNLGANLVFKSHFTNDINYTPATGVLLTLPAHGYQVANLNAAYTWSRYTIRGYLNNVFNKQYIVGGSIVSANSYYLATPGEPRSFEVTFKVAF